MSRQALRWVGMGLLVVVLVVTFVNLGRWQLDRLEQRRDRNSTVVAHEHQPVRPYTDVLTGTVGDDDQWYRVTATGTYLPEQFQVRYRTLDGAYGSEIVGVLKTAQGDLLLVDRGFLPRQAGYPDGEMPAVMTGEVTVTGYVRRNDRGDESAMTPHESQIRLINSEVLGRALGVELLDGYVSLIESSPADAGGLTPLGIPELNEGSHFSYALQWFSFSLIAIVGLVVLIRADIRDRKKAKARAAKAAAAAEAGT
ncbi:MAG: SURF1 family protein [Arachnia sp.]